MNAPIRVFQVATGNVGSEMIKRLGHRTDLELVGLHCYSPEKSAVTPARSSACLRSG